MRVNVFYCNNSIQLNFLIVCELKAIFSEDVYVLTQNYQSTESEALMLL